MSLKRQIRFTTGGAAVLTLLGLIATETIYAGVTMTLQNKLILISLISALLSVDIAIDQIPMDRRSLARLPTGLSSLLTSKEDEDDE